jgi:endonuclease G, mitochondrial
VRRRVEVPQGCEVPSHSLRTRSPHEPLRLGRRRCRRGRAHWLRGGAHGTPARTDRQDLRLEVLHVADERPALRLGHSHDESQVGQIRTINCNYQIKYHCGSAGTELESHLPRALSRRQVDVKSPMLPRLNTAATSWALYLVAGIGLAACAEQDGPCKFGCPSSDGRIDAVAGRLVFGTDARLKHSRWVAERIDRESTQRGDHVKRSNAFFPDERIPTAFRSQDDHYRSSGFTRGHLAPAMDHSASQTTSDATFSFANISPQLAGFNSGRWLQLETFAKSLVHLYEEVFILTGPLFLPAFGGLHSAASMEDALLTSQGPAEYWAEVRYPVIGQPPDAVPVPTHFFKVVLAMRPRSRHPHAPHECAVGAFVLPHSNVWPRGSELSQYAVSLASLQQAAGLEFFRERLSLDAVQSIDQQAAELGLGRGHIVGKWLAMRDVEIRRLVRSSEERSTTHPDTPRVPPPPKPYRLGVSSPLPVEYLSVDAAPSVAGPLQPFPDPASDAKRVVSGHAGTVLSSATARTVQVGSLGDVMGSAIAGDGGLAPWRLLHLCAAVRCDTPAMPSFEKNAKREKFILRWRQPSDPSYDYQWLESALRDVRH